jgi:hypothetical protein
LVGDLKALLTTVNHELPPVFPMKKNPATTKAKATCNYKTLEIFFTLTGALLFE